MKEASPKISVDYGDKATMVTLKYEKILEEQDILAFESSISPIVAESDNIHLIINFCNVQFLSSSMLGLLIKINKSVEETNGKLRLCCINERIMGIFKITRLDKVFHICDGVSESIASFEN